jgi:hypothetical protein
MNWYRRQQEGGRACDLCAHDFAAFEAAAGCSA